MNNKFFFYIIFVFIWVQTGCTVSKKTPEGVFVDSLSDKETREVISFFRDYLASDIIATLIDIREDKLDSAIEIQEFILDEIVYEMYPSPNRYTESELEALKSTYIKIADYYSIYPRSKRKWYQELSPEKKQKYSNIDAQLTEVIARSDFETKKESSVKSTIALIFFRDYMASLAIQTLEKLAQGQKESALWDLEEVVDMSIKENRSLLSEHQMYGSDELNQLYKISKYRTKYPRAANSWYSFVSEKQKEDDKELDAMLAHAVSSNWVAGCHVFFDIEDEYCK